MQKLGINQYEELKEEIEEKLIRLDTQISATAHDGSLVYTQPRKDHLDKFFTYSVGDILKNTVIRVNPEEGVKEIQTPGIDISSWYSCQMNAKTLFQVEHG